VSCWFASTCPNSVDLGLRQLLLWKFTSRRTDITYVSVHTFLNARKSPGGHAKKIYNFAIIGVNLILFCMEM